MLRGIYTAASGMQMQSLRQQTIADNLANVNTTGFKSAQNLYKSFADQAIQNNTDGTEVGGLSRGVDTHGTAYRFEQGSLRQTSNPLDMSMSGDGFFAVQKADGKIEYTRNGHFTLDSQGYLVTQNGENVLDEGLAPIFLGLEGIRDITVLNNGELHVNGEFKNIIGKFDFPQGAAVMRTDADRFVLNTPMLAMTPSQNSNIRQGFLEISNVSAVQSATEMIQVMRGYEANQRVITNQMDTLQMLMDVGRI